MGRIAAGAESIASGRYQVQWSLLLVLIGVFVAAPLAVALVFDVSLWAVAGAWFVVFSIGAGGAGLRMLGWGAAPTQHYDPDERIRRDVDRQFTPPHNEGNLL